MSLGEAAVRFASRCVRDEVSGTGDCSPPDEAGFDENRGVFVTLNRHPSGELRGCIGYPYPVMPLSDALSGAARSACHDPRFPDLHPSELDGITVGVTILTVPEELEAEGPEGIPDLVEIGRDGLIIECMGRRGLLLPQVPVEWGWDKIEYLEHLSAKAGLPKDAWTWDGTKLYAFGGTIFSETSPGGEIVEVHINGHRDSHTGPCLR